MHSQMVSRPSRQHFHVFWQEFRVSVLRRGISLHTQVPVWSCELSVSLGVTFRTPKDKVDNCLGRCEAGRQPQPCCLLCPCRALGPRLVTAAVEEGRGEDWQRSNYFQKSFATLSQKLLTPRFTYLQQQSNCINDLSLFLFPHSQNQPYLHPSSAASPTPSPASLP